MTHAPLRAAGLAILAVLGTALVPATARADSEPCIECLKVRVGPPVVVRGPFPDELDAPFTALRLKDGSFRGFSANGSTYALEGTSLWDMDGPRREVLEAGAPGEESECGRWLTSTIWTGDAVLGFVHQESICDYGPWGQTDKTMAIAISSDDGLSWTDLGTVISGRDTPRPGTTSGEGDCTMIDGMDGYLYAYCLRTSDWQTIAARADPSTPTDWRKYYLGGWSEPGLRGRATPIGFLGPGASYMPERGWVATVTNDPWFGGLRLSLSEDKVTFVDLDEPLLAFDDSDWDRPADTDLVAYITLLNPEDGSNAIGNHSLISYIYVPPGKGFESRYLVHHEMTLSVADAPLLVKAGMALTRWVAPSRQSYVTSTGPLTGERQAYEQDTIVAYMLTTPPDGVDSIQLAECSKERSGVLDHLVAEDGSCETAGYIRERISGWLYADEQPGTVPVYRCIGTETKTHFLSNQQDCEGLGAMDRRLGYGIAS